MQNLLYSGLIYKKKKIKIYRTVVLPVVLYGCETWSLTLREERRLRVNFMVTPCINNIQHFIFQLMHKTLKNVELLKHFKIRKLLQHVPVYKETIIREPQPVLS